MALDKTKPYGTVYAVDTSIKYKFEQGGKFFNAQGLEVDPKTGAILEDPYADIKVPAIKARLDALDVDYSGITKREDLLSLLKDEEKAEAAA